jgi:hypothetical protein
MTLFHSSLLLLAGFVFSIFISCIRYFEDQSYFDSLVVGWLIGIWMGFNFAYFLREPFYIHIDNLNECE